MITDVFYRRYPNLQVIGIVDQRVRAFVFQAFRLITHDLWLNGEGAIRYEERNKALQAAHDRLALELGTNELVKRHFAIRNVPGRTVGSKAWDTVYTEFMNIHPSQQQGPNNWLAERLSLVEQVLASFADFKRDYDESYERRLHAAVLSDKKVQEERAIYIDILEAPVLRVDRVKVDHVLQQTVDELNERFSINRIPLEYHNGLIQAVHNPLLSQQVSKPFWAIVSDPMWGNVDTDMKKALDTRDAGLPDAHFAALKALESVVKIISDAKGRSIGTENGAAAYVSNLVRQVDGVRFIDVWESDMLVNLFSKVRNPFGHGAGNKPMPLLSAQQTDWAINEAMNWIVSLIKRM
ncbi:hypothetical protein ASF00_09260 [Sphingomonas sp. Leaf34]|uniref:AbiJ-NTD4 domain-containing protein n=1 Tax=Sphingomonas sp. Leaf34 TaxID=1736216 RepID=UPI0006F7FAE2|nr:hypothetical protein [Sphingomonas sp. Leaf34]KQN28086.1 hypothetical protein ASF00_09260 [Sphingomonas sp. Leaf34]